MFVVGKLSLDNSKILDGIEPKMKLTNKPIFEAMNEWDVYLIDNFLSKFYRGFDVHFTIDDTLFYTNIWTMNICCILSHKILPAKHTEEHIYVLSNLDL